MEKRRNHPLVQSLAKLRLRHGIASSDLDACMGMPVGTLRHIEKGRRPLPGLQDGLSSWIQNYLNCVGATEDERNEIRQQISRALLLEWSEDLQSWTE